MAIRRPLVVVQGSIKELPIGDSLDAAETPILFAVPVAGTDDLGNPAILFDSDGDVVLVMRREGEL